jgi:lipopolysaccharide transport system ATP-binding protein
MVSAIKINKVTKRYCLGKIGSGYFYRDVKHFFRKVFSGKSGFDNEEDRTINALNNITLDIAPGESVGIIGRNGSGKSTLLKLLAGVTLPSNGTIEIDGRVASLLDIGTGFQGDLSGRENIYLNGAILGMSRDELRSRFDDIVVFSGIDRYLDTPVKRYSTGMYIRLAFSIAIHCVADILLVDEILAAADRQFLISCREKLRELTKSNTTLLIVSHNLKTIRELCSRTILIAEGNIIADGKTDDVLTLYRSSTTTFCQ